MRCPQCEADHQQPSTRCHKFIAHGYAALARDLLDAREAPPALDVCSVCRQSLSTKPLARRHLYYCDDCCSPVRQCGECILECHRIHPFHHIHRWDATRRIWSRVALSTIGFEFCLEHAGARCPTAPSEARDFVVVHDHGIEPVSIVPCACLNPPPLTTQLMRAGLWPATWENPRTAITIRALKVFQSLSVTAHTTAHDFISHLQNLTDIIAPEEVQVMSTALGCGIGSDMFIPGPSTRVPDCCEDICFRARMSACRS